mgnify:CR=1 FL=1
MTNGNERILTYNLKRTGFDENIEGNIIYIFSLIGYLIVFGIYIPYILIKYDAFFILEGYLPNLDMIATVLGYSEGPFGIFKYLYNPSTDSVIGIFSSLIINYTALLGVTFTVSYYTLKTKNLFEGWSRAFIMLLATYLVPGYFVAYFLYYFGNKIKPYFEINSFENWLITVIAGLISVFIIVYIEGVMIEKFSPSIVRLLKHINRMIQQF